MTELDETTISIDDIWVNSNNILGERVIGIAWSCNIGFGEYTIYYNKKDGTIEGASECMDSNKDKEFIHALFNKIIDKIDIIE